MSSTPHLDISPLTKLGLARLADGEHIIPLCRAESGACGCGWSFQHADPGKAPLIAWKALSREGVTPSLVEEWGRKWPRAGVGTLIEPSGWLVIDVDSEDAQREADRLGLPDTLIQRTRKGSHYIYRRPADAPCTRITGGGASGKLDLLSAGYIVSAPSIHVSGTPYIRIAHDVAEAPTWAVEWLHEKAAALQVAQVQARAAIQAALRRGDWPDHEEIESALYALDPDCDYEEWIEIGQALHAYHEGCLPMWDLWSSAGGSWMEGVCAKHWRSFNAGGGRSHRTIFRKAYDRGWTVPDHLKAKVRRDLGMRIDARSAEPATAPRDMTEPAYLREAPPLDPPGDDGDGERGGRRGGGYPDVIPFDSDVVLARIVADVVQGDSPVALVSDEGALWRYGAGLWSCVDPSEVSVAVQGLDRMSVDTGKVDDAGMPKLRPFKVRAATIRAVSEVVAQLGGVAQPGHFAEAPRGVAFADAFVQVEGGGRVVVRPPSAAHRARVGMPWAWDAGAECPRWEAALDQWMMPAAIEDGLEYDPRADADAKAMFLQEFIGAALLGLGPQYQRCALLLGSGANGKSVFLKTIERLFPATARDSVSPQSLGGSAGQYHLASLAGKRLNVVSEMPEADILHAEAFKAVITGDAIGARHPSGRPFTLRAEAAHVFAANALPRTRDQSDGFWRRFVLVTFPNTFAGEGCDPALSDALADELPGICRWAIDGAARLIRAGRYTLPPSSMSSLAEWQADSDPVGCWLDERTQAEDDPGRFATASALWEDFKAWADAARMATRMGRRTFFERLKARVHCRRTASGQRYAVSLLLIP